MRAIEMAKKFLICKKDGLKHMRIERYDFLGYYQLVLDPLDLFFAISERVSL